MAEDHLADVGKMITVSDKNPTRIKIFPKTDDQGAPTGRLFVITTFSHSLLRPCSGQVEYENVPAGEFL